MYEVTTVLREASGSGEDTTHLRSVDSGARHRANARPLSAVHLPCGSFHMSQSCPQQQWYLQPTKITQILVMLHNHTVQYGCAVSAYRHRSCMQRQDSVEIESSATPTTLAVLGTGGQGASLALQVCQATCI
jgi:hypothetical protein